MVTDLHPVEKSRETLDEARVSFYNVVVYEKTLTKTVEYISKFQRAGEGGSRYE